MFITLCNQLQSIPLVICERHIKRSIGQLRSFEDKRLVNTQLEVVLLKIIFDKEIIFSKNFSLFFSILCFSVS